MSLHNTLRDAPQYASLQDLLVALVGKSATDKLINQLEYTNEATFLRNLARLPQSALTPAAWRRLTAATEFAKRWSQLTDTDADSVRDPDRLARNLVARYLHHVQERLGAIYLDAKNRPIREREIYVGTLNATTVSTRDIFRHALEDGAASLILFHNHPSGDPAPSAEDLIFTKKCVEAGRLLGVDVIDHLILGMNRYVSLRDRGAM